MNVQLGLLAVTLKWFTNWCHYRWDLIWQPQRISAFIGANPSRPLNYLRLKITIPTGLLNSRLLIISGRQLILEFELL
jgi:hypothetical protein